MITTINEYKQSIKTRIGGEAYSLIMGRKLKPKLKKLLDKYRSTIGIANINNKNVYNTREMSYTHTFEINFRDVIMADTDMKNIKNLINDLENFRKDNDFRNLGVTLKRGGGMNNDVITQKIEDVLNINPANYYKLSFNFWMIANDSIQVDVNEKKTKKHDLLEQILGNTTLDELFFNNTETISEAVELKSDVIDIKKLEKYATAIAIICSGEYGITHFNPTENKIFVCLGDANPFDIEYLESFIKDAIKIDYKTEDEISIEIDMECGPNNNEDGWLTWNGKDWDKLEY